MTEGIKFKFQPKQFVKITLHGINYSGRVMRCIWDGMDQAFKVQYVDDRGEFKLDEFFADELEAAK